MTGDQAAEAYRPDAKACYCIEIHRRNGKILHTFSRNDDGEWEVATPPPSKGRNVIGGDGRRYNLRVDGVYLYGGPEPSDDLYNLGDGIPAIREHKLHRILDGLAAAGIGSIDSDGLIRLITARR